MLEKMIKKFLFIFIFYYIAVFSYSSLLESPVDTLKIPSGSAFLKNLEYLTSFKNKRITVAEYVTDPLIMYASLWGLFFATLKIWESPYNASTWELTNKWQPDFDRGLDKLLENQNTFGDRLKMEPFATGRIDPVTKEWNSMIVFRGDIYAKNIIEPIYFTYLALYMRSKNYHPAIMITEIILLSLIYELTIRPFFMNSSFEQLLKNPAISIVVAILFDELSTYLLSTPYKGLHVLAYILNPFNSLPNSRIHPMLFVDPYKKNATIEMSIRF
jgi:hypothetical protein